MSQRNRVARVSGMNNNFPGQLPARSSYYAAAGSPGLTAGPATGFSVAFGIRPPILIGGDTLGTPWIDPVAEEAALADPYIALPQSEFVAGDVDVAAATGWGIIVGANDINVLVGDTILVVDTTLRHGEMIGLMSFVPDATEYAGGLGAVTLASLAVNGDLAAAVQASAFGYVAAGTGFSVGGSADAAFAADPQALGGSVRTEITSLWVTDGIPTLDESNQFFQASMEAGVVIPQAWAPARTVAEPEPEAPESPTGNYWTADGVNLGEGLGSVWSDKIGSADLMRVSPGANPVEGDLRVSARQPYFWYTA
jgi:hypothetical protein